MSGTLYVVGTPIGNLSDMSPRGLETLKLVDFIAAEDTRVTLKLLNAYDIHKSLVSCHEHNIKERSEQITARLLNGESCAVVTDAGLPCISDPGEQLVQKCREMGIPVASVPGPTAFATALSVAGFGAARFSFEGFLSTVKRRRREHLEEIKDHRQTLVFYEAPHKLIYTLHDIRNSLGNRRMAVARELTKLYEEVLTGDVDEMIAHFESTAPKGEFVLIVEGAKPPEKEDAFTLEEAAELAGELMDRGMSASAAAKEAALQTGYKKGDIYKLIAGQ